MAVALSLLLAGCSSNGQSAYKDYFSIVRQVWSARSGAITLKQAASIPYASLGFRVNGSQQQLLVLATDTGGELLWTAASHIVLQTRDGRLLRTVGLPHDLGGTTTGTTPPAPKDALQGAVSTSREMDFPDLQLFGVHVACRAAARGRTTVAILGKPIHTTRVDEHCSARSGDWSFTNTYWIDAESGFVWKSRQTVHPKGDVIDIEILRPPS